METTAKLVSGKKTCEKVERYLHYVQHNTSPRLQYPTLRRNTSSAPAILGDMTIEKIDPLISEDFRRLFQYVCYGGVCQVIAAFGVVTNVINIICFLKQGFKDSVNVSLFGLAISDLGCLVTIMWLNICVMPAFQEADFSFDQVDIQYLTAAYPHVVFTRVTSWITAFITLERCLCIAVPLKVKRIFTPRKVSYIIASTFVLLILSATPFYSVNVFSFKFHPVRNRTVFGLIRTEARTIVERASFAINNAIIPFGSFVTVTMCTALLIVKLEEKSKWRKSATSAASDILLIRDQKVVKMVLLISTVFIISFIPSCISFFAVTAEPELSIDGVFHNTFVVVFGIGFVLETMNSAVNIFIYYRMSSKYRETFQQMFKLQHIVGQITPMNDNFSLKKNHVRPHFLICEQT